MKNYLLILLALLTFMIITFFAATFYGPTNSNENVVNNTDINETDLIKETDKVPEEKETDFIIQTDKVTGEKEEEEEKEKEEEEKEDDLHYFTATYKSEKGKKIKAFNTFRLRAEDLKYSISYLPGDSNSVLRRNDETENLEEIPLNNTLDGSFVSPVDDFVTIRVYFNKSLPNLDFLFQACNDLISIDLSTINSFNITRFSYTFNECKNLEKINLTSLDTSNVQYMEFLFAGCDNLVDVIGLETLNTSSLKVATGIFFNCKNLQIANLSSFDLDNVEEAYGIFVNTESLQVVDLGNCTEANHIFNPIEELNVIIIGNNSINTSLLSGNINVYNSNEINNITDIIAELSCIIGDGDKCLECNNEEGKKNLCSKCNYGYYLPEGTTLSKTKCKKCEEGCIECHSQNDSDISICDWCEMGYYNLYEGKCIKYCEIGYGEQCQNCKNESEGKNNECSSCNDGYYLDIYNKSVCKKGDIENCTKYLFESEYPQCIECSQGYMLHENKCYKVCETGLNEKCKTCNPLFEFREYCQTCNDQYYLYNGINSTQCRHCGNKNYCKSCEEIGGEIFCTNCSYGYTLVDGKCFLNCDNDCTNCTFDGINKGNCSQCTDGTALIVDFYYLYNYRYLDEYDLDSSSDSEFIKYQNAIYTCRPCPYGCKTCPNNDYYDYYYNPNDLNCTSCEEGFKLVDNKCLLQCETYFSSDCLTCDKDVEYACSTCHPNYFLNITSKKCVSCGIDNCARCNEKKECLECDIDYELENNKCIKVCEIGSEKKCKTCNTNNEHREECLTCNDGYFLPQDTNKKECVKCPKYCTNCYGETNKTTCTSCESCSFLKEGKCNKIIAGDKEIICALCDLDICVECGEGYYMNDGEVKYCIPCGQNVKKCHKQNGLIVIDECIEGYKINGGKCIKECEKGGLDKCLSCKTNPGEINQCAECNTGFFMPSDSLDKEKCYKCQEKGCIKCSGTINNNICNECHENYMLFEGKCIKNCEIGSNDKCSSCNNIAGSNDRCAECNSRYYLPDYSSDYNRNLKCKRCPSDCKNCHGDYDNPICTECSFAGYIIRKGKCIKGCSYLLNNHCNECDDSGDFPICRQCKEGYYYPINNAIYYDRCIRCSMYGCKKCNNFDECLECNSEYSPIIIDDKIQSCLKMCDIGSRNKCKSCSDVVGECGQCNDGFELSGGKCIIKEYDALAEYETTEDNEIVLLMNCDSIEFIEVDGESIVLFSYIREILIEKKGIHIIKFKLVEYTSFAGLFTNNPYLKSIIFYDHFESSLITLMNNCFTNCPNLEYADLSKLDLSNNHCFMGFFQNDKKLKEVHFPEKEIKNANYLYGMFQNCESLTSVDISSFSNDHVYAMDSMFDGCTNLKSIKIGGLKNTIISNHRILFGLPSSGNITISKEYKNLLEDKIPENWVVEIDDPNYKKTILIAGDSTADSNGGNNGKTEGWGKYLGNYISTEVNNLAFLGESARSFYRDGRWKNLIKKVTKGDYIFIQFGHFDDGDVNTNSKSAVDGTGDETVTINVNGVNETVHTFPWYIKYFANQVLVKGATPVLLSLTPDFKFTDGKIAETNKYQGYMKTVAEELKITYIDLYSYIKKNYETLGEQYLKNNNWFPSDTIHTSPEAANFNAKMIINAIKCQEIDDLIDNINSEGNTIDYPCLDDN